MFLAHQSDEAVRSEHRLFLQRLANSRLPGAVLRFLWKELQQRQRENGKRARAGVRNPPTVTLNKLDNRKLEKIHFSGISGAIFRAGVREWVPTLCLRE